MACPLKGQMRCTKELCGHCSKCHKPLDEHDGLGMDGKPAECRKAA